MEFRQREDNIILEKRASAVLYLFISSQVRGTYLLPVNICPIVYDVFLTTGNQVEFIDIDKKNYCIDSENLLRTLETKEYRGVLLNHTYGVDIDLSEVISTLKSAYNKLIIIEDKCLCFPNLEINDSVDLTIYSTGYAKNIELSYGGGYGIVKDNWLIEYDFQKIKKGSCKNTKFDVGFFDIDKERYFSDIDIYRESAVFHKKKLNDIYNYYLNQFTLGNVYNNWRYNILCRNKELLLKKIFSQDLFASSHYRLLGGEMSMYNNAYNLYNSIINLFNDKYFSEKQAEDISKLILNYIEPGDYF